MKISEELRQRGLLDWSTDREAVDALLDGDQMVTVYVGFDPTADSLHLGHIIPLMALRRLQKAGHRPIVLAGGCTAMVGDPSGKKSDRQLLTLEAIEHNKEAVKKQLAHFVDFDCGANSAILADNYDWLGKLSLVEFLRDVGKYFTVNTMIRKEHVRSRIEDPDKSISYTEFTYTMLQGYDFWHLFHQYDCRLQMGGNDQQGNLISGVELIHKKDGERVFAASSPLLINTDGTKFGKSEGNALWLDPKLTSPYKMHQFLLNTEDAMVEKQLKLFTDLDLETIDQVMAQHHLDPSARLAQRTLADQLVTLLHGTEAARSAAEAGKILFGSDVETVDDAILETVAGETGKVTLEALPQMLNQAVVSSGFCGSKGDFKRLVAGGAVVFAGQKVTDDRMEVTAEHFGDRHYLLLRLGKKKFAVVQRPSA